MLKKPIDEITITDITNLITGQAAENRRLEFKQAFEITGVGDRKEFLADVSAFANTSGGYIVFGAKEATARQ